MFLAFAFAQPVAAEADCAEFSTQALVQDYFTLRGERSSNSEDGLDADRDVFVWESRPYSTRSSSSTFVGSDCEPANREWHEGRMTSYDRYNPKYGEGGSASFLWLLELLFNPVGPGVLYLLRVIGLLNQK